MEQRRFDRLARALATSGSRRALSALLGSALGWLALGPGSSSAMARKKKDKKRRRKDKLRVEGPCGNGSPRKNACKRDRQCCTGYCRSGRCRCRKLNQSCSEDRNCCPANSGRTCQDGTCQPVPTCAGQGEACGNGLPCCAGSACQAGTCQPEPLACADTCAGCCEGESCEEGTSIAACGAGGQSCQVCAETERCWDGVCVCGDVCASGCQFTSLQQAIDEAGDADTLRLCAETYGGTFTISKDLTLLGSGDGANGTILNGGGAGPVVAIAITATVELRDLMITGGNSDDFGGGILSDGALGMTGVTLTGNFAEVSGGGIVNTGTLQMTGCAVSGNEAGQIGGGINNRDTLTLTGCAVSGNSAGSIGGGIFNAGSGTVTLNGGAVSGNQAGQLGGGILNSGTVTLEAGAIITANHAGDNGGGIYNDGISGIGTSTCSGRSVSGNTVGDPTMPNDCVAVGSGSCGTC